uniref:Peroxisomal membrane protein MPV17 n=1 Tax=Alexandrium catenella TaxID=2925 RepID=A0A7S1WJV1_ALECA
MAEAQPRSPGFLARQLATRPMATNSATSGLISVIAELLRHWLTADAGALPEVANVRRQFLIGSMVVAPLATNWHALVERLFRKWEAGRLLTVLAKTAAEQMFFAPVINVAFMTSQGLLEGRTPEEVRDEVREKFVEVMKGNFAFWVPTGLIQYKFVPPRLRVIFANLMSVLWTIYLISKTSKAAAFSPTEIPAIKVTDATPRAP